MSEPNASSPQGLGEADFLNLLTMFASAPFPADVLVAHRDRLPTALRAAVRDPSTISALVERLSAQGLLLGDASGIAVAQTTRFEVRGRLTDEQRRQWAATAVDLLCAAFPDDSEDIRSWPDCERLLEHAVASVAQAESVGMITIASADLLHRAGVYLRRIGRYFEARECLEQAMSLLDAGIDVTGSLKALLSRALSEVLLELNESSRARSFAEDALESHRTVRGSHDPDVALDHIALAEIHVSLDELDTAEAHLRQAVDISEKDASTRSCDAQARKSLGWVLQQKGHSKEARVELELALSTLVDIWGATSHYAAGARTALGVVLDALGDSEGARVQQEQALADIEAALGPEHPEVAVVLSNLASLCAAVAELDLARTYLERSLSLASVTLPADHPAKRWRHNKLADVFERQGQLKASREHRERALAITEHLYAPDDRRIVKDLDSLGETLIRLGDHRVALAMFRRALYIAEVAYGPEHASVRKFHGLCAELCRQLGDMTGALASYQMLVEAHQRQANSDGLPILAARLTASRLISQLSDHLARAYEVAGFDEMARPTREHGIDAVDGLARSAAETSNASLLLLASLTNLQAGTLELARTPLEHLTRMRPDGDDTPDEALAWEPLAGAWQQLGRSFMNEKRYDDALLAYDEGLSVACSPSEPDSRVQGVVLHSAADVHREQGDRETAIAIYRRAAEKKRTAKDLRGLTVTLQALAKTLASNGQVTEALDVYGQRMEILRSLPDPHSAAQALTLRDMARICDSPDRAIELYQQALDLLDAPDERIARAAVLHSQGRQLERRQEFADARAAYRERLSILTSLSERDHQGEGVTLHDIGDVCRAQGEVDEAIALYEQAARHKRVARRSPDLATTLLALGRALESRGDDDAALGVYEECARVLVSVSPAEADGKGTRFAELARIHFTRGRLDQAEDLCKKAIDALRDTGSSQLAEMLMQSVSLRLGQGEELEARRLAVEAVELLRQQGGDPIAVAMALILEARCAEADPKVAFRCLESAIAQLTSVSKERAQEMAAMTSLISEIYCRLGDHETACLVRKYAEAVFLCEAPKSGDLFEGGEPDWLLAASAFLGVGKLDLAMDALERATGLKDVSQTGLAGSWHRLGRALALAGEYSQADIAYEKALDLQRDQPKDLRHVEGMVLHDRGDILRAERKIESAIALYRKAIEKKGDGKHPSDLATSLLALGRALRATDRQDEAIVAFEERLVVLGTLRERNRQREGITWHDIADVRLSQGRLEDARNLYRRALTLKKHDGKVDPRDVVTTLALARVGYLLKSPSTRRWIAQVNEVLDRGEIVLQRRWWVKDMRLLAQSSPWPSDGRRAWRAAERLHVLTPAAVAKLARLVRAERRTETGIGTLLRGRDDCEQSVVNELEAAGLVRRGRNADLRTLTANGRQTGALLHSSGVPPPGIAGRLRIEAAASPDHGVHLALIGSRAALMCGEVARAEELLDGLDTLSSGVGSDRIASISAQALLSGCDRSLGRTVEAKRLANTLRPELLSLIESTRESDELLALAGAALSCDDLILGRQALERLDTGVARERGCRPDIVDAAIAWHTLAAGHEAGNDVEMAWDAYRRSGDLLQSMGLEMHAAVMRDAADMFRAAGDTRRASEISDLIGFEPGSLSLRVLLGIGHLRVSRLLRLVEAHLPSLTAAMRAAVQLRFAIPPQGGSARGGRSSADDGNDPIDIEPKAITKALSLLSPPALALLDLLREDAEASRARGILPGLFFSPDDAWTTFYSALELERGGFVYLSVAVGSIVLAGPGLDAGRLLVEES